jgi:hypothetical protein
VFSILEIGLKELLEISSDSNALQIEIREKGQEELIKNFKEKQKIFYIPKNWFMQ